MASAKIEIGKVYVSKGGNTVELYDKLEEIEGQGEVWRGKLLTAVKGHEALVGKTHRFNADGRWLNDDRKLVDNCIHDLAELAKGD